MSQKNILIITYNDYPSYDGIGVRIKNLAKIYAKHGNRVIIFAPNLEKKRPGKEIVEGITVLRAKIPILKKLVYYRIIIRIYTLILQTLLSFSFFFRHLRNLKIDIIQAEQVHSIPPALVLKIFTGSRVFVDDITTVSDILHNSGHRILSKSFTFAEKILFRMCDEFIYTSEACRNYCADRGVSPAIFVPNGVDCEKFRPVQREKRNEKVIFFNCSTYFDQNIEAIKNFLDIGTSLKGKTASPFTFHLVCGPKSNIPKELYNRIIAEKAWFLFEESVPDIETRIQTSDLTLLPYSPGHHITGGARLKSLEYMACGKTVVSTPEGVEGIEGLVSNDYLIIVNAISEFVPVLRDILNSKIGIQYISTKAREFVTGNFDWKTVVEPMLQVLDS